MCLIIRIFLENLLKNVYAIARLRSAAISFDVNVCANIQQSFKFRTKLTVNVFLTRLIYIVFYLFFLYYAKLHRELE